MSKILIAGSRSLTSSPILASVVSSLIAQGHTLHTGCAAGADAIAIFAALRSGSFSQLRVFAAFAPSGAGACGVSAVVAVKTAAAAGVSVSWLAGGALSVPLAARLIKRSQSALAGCSAAVFFAPGAGSLAVAAHAVAQGIPVFAFAPNAPAAPRGCAGHWAQSSFCGLSCWQWQASQLALF